MQAEFEERNSLIAKAWIAGFATLGLVGAFQHFKEAAAPQSLAAKNKAACQVVSNHSAYLNSVFSDRFAVREDNGKCLLVLKQTPAPK